MSVVRLQGKRSIVPGGGHGEGAPRYSRPTFALVWGQTTLAESARAMLKGKNVPSKY